MQNEIFLYPPWKEAVQQFLSANFQPNDIIPFDWFYTAFNIERPTADTPKATADKAELQFLSQFHPFQKELLVKHQIDLSNERGVGYRIVPPGDQTGEAFEDGLNDLRKAFRVMGRRLLNVNTAKLTSDQRKENADKLAKLGMMTGMLRNVRRLPFAGDKQEEQAG